MRNDIINYATGEPVTTIAVYYDKLVKEDELKHVNRLNYLCASLYGERGLVVKSPIRRLFVTYSRKSQIQSLSHSKRYLIYGIRIVYFFIQKRRTQYLAV